MTKRKRLLSVVFFVQFFGSLAASLLKWKLKTVLSDKNDGVKNKEVKVVINSESKYSFDKNQNMRAAAEFHRLQLKSSFQHLLNLEKKIAKI